MFKLYFKLENEPVLCHKKKPGISIVIKFSIGSRW